MTLFDDHMTDKLQPIDHIIPDKLKRRIVRRRATALTVEIKSLTSCIISEFTLNSQEVGAKPLNSDETSLSLHR